MILEEWKNIHLLEIGVKNLHPSLFTQFHITRPPREPCVLTPVLYAASLASHILPVTVPVSYETDPAYC